MAVSASWQPMRKFQTDRCQLPVCQMRLCLANASVSATPSSWVWVSGFSPKTSLPLSAAAIETSACQWSGVDWLIASMSLRAINSR